MQLEAQPKNDVAYNKKVYRKLYYNTCFRFLTELFAFESIVILWLKLFV